MFVYCCTIIYRQLVEAYVFVVFLILNKNSQAPFVRMSFKVHEATCICNIAILQMNVETASCGSFY